MTSDNRLASWNERADRFCEAWSSEVGRPDFDTLSKIYAADADVVIYDTLPPIEGFRGFEQMRHSIYPELKYIHVRRTGPIDVKRLADGSVVVTSYPFHLSYGFLNGTGHEIEARISEVWERRTGEYVIVHEHPSTVYALAPTGKSKSPLSGDSSHAAAGRRKELSAACLETEAGPAASSTFAQSLQDSRR